MPPLKTNTRTSPKKPRALEAAIKAGRYRNVHRANVTFRVEAIRHGLSATVMKQMADHMAISQERLYGTLGLPRATVVRKARQHALMNPDESERLLGLAELIGQVQEMVARTGDPTDFDAAKWVAQWMEQPLPALGGKRPAEWMDTAPGRQLVSDTIARMESGAYA